MAGRRRRFSTGSRVMLLMVLIVSLSSAFVFIRLSNGSRLNYVTSDGKAIPTGESASSQYLSQSDQANQSETGQAVPTAPGSLEMPPPVSETEHMTITVGGTVAVEKAIRQSCYVSDSKSYDFTDVMKMLSDDVQGDISFVFLENVFTDDAKVSETIVPSAAASMLSAAGFQVGLAGFSKAWQKDMEGISDTSGALRENGLEVLGICEQQESARTFIRNIHGIQAAFMQYTANVPSNVRKSMQKKDVLWSVPEADINLITADIHNAHDSGADLVIVFLNWGKEGKKEPEKRQKELAQQIAEAGADMIIGAGSRVTQRIEMLTTSDRRHVLCAYSLGALISENRTSSDRLGSILLQFTFIKEENSVRLEEIRYIPVYVWRYRQDGNYYYRCLASDREPPDGMDDEQKKIMNKVFAAVQKVMAEGPVAIR